ncbi:MAG: aminoglycoside phosphotransferase [Candidatus Roseilinea sp.]|nr:MAG: aminoglycoside phosphotransferase [Candidatus Roseilinea sp.]
MDVQVLAAYGLEPQRFDVQPFGHGHINKTYLATDRAGDAHYILQRINTNVFKQPQIIARNHRLAGDYLARTQPDYLLPHIIPTAAGDDLYCDGASYWRMTPYVPNTVALNEATSPQQAYEAARQFGRLARLTADIDLSEFRPTIPNFHNLALRFEAFEQAIASADDARRRKASDLIEAMLAAASIVETYVALVRDGGLPDRLMHHDTKINNVLLHQDTFEGVCVIDLDTLMPGKILSDVGDMVRTYVCPVSEEVRDVSRVVVREAYFAALMDGYLSEMRGALTLLERELLFYAGEFMIYMQALRFLTDYLAGDVYYPITYDAHNLDRARNQWALLTCLRQKERSLREIIRKCL